MMCAPLQRLFHQTVLLLVFILVLPLLPGCSDSPNEEARKTADEHRFRAQSFLNQGQLRAALIEAQNAENALPAQAETMALTARVFETLGALDKAETLFSKLADAGKLAEPDARLYVRTLLERRRFAKALEVLKAGPHDDMPALRAQALMGMSRIGDAHEAITLAGRESDDPLDTAVAEAKFHFINRDRKALEAALDKLGQQGNWRASLWQARLEQASGRDEAAVESLSRVLAELSQQDVLTAWRFEALRRMMEGLIRLDRPGEAREYSQTLAQSRAGELASRYDTALAEAREGNYSEASALFKEILNQSPHHGGSAMALGMIAFNQKSWQDAQQYLSTAVESGNDSARSIKLLATVLLENSQPERALEEAERGLRDFPGDTDMLALKGLALQRLEQPDDAASAFRQVLEQAPDNVGALISLGQIALQKGDLETAETRFSSALEQTSAPAAWRGLVMVADGRGLRDRGLDKLRGAAAESNNAELWLLAATLGLQFQNIDQARTDARKALSLDENLSHAQALLGALDYLEARRAFTRAEYDLSYQFADRAAGYMPDDLAILLLKASAATAAGKPENALAVARQLQQKAPDLHHGYELEGDIHTQLDNMKTAGDAYTKAWARQRNPVLAGKYMSAIEANGRDGMHLLQRWVESEPDNSAAWLTLASNLEQQNRLSEAIAAYEKVNELVPESAPILNNLAWLYFQTGDERAGTTAADAYALAPDNPAIADTYGWILWHAGDKDRARQLIEQAAEAAPDDDGIRQHLVEVQGDASL